jgi:hypothetical protein
MGCLGDDLVAACAAGELTAAEIDEVEEHIDGCAA